MSSLWAIPRDAQRFKQLHKVQLTKLSASFVNLCETVIEPITLLV